MFWIILISGLALATFFAWKNTKSAPVSGLKLKIKDGADKAISTAKDIADVNNDGKVDFADAVAAVKNVEAETKRRRGMYPTVLRECWLFMKNG